MLTDEAGAPGAVADPPADELPATGSSTTTLSPEAVLNSPEYRELTRQNRALARRAGTAERQAAEARATAERERQAAEAREREAQSTEIAAILGDDGVAEWNEIAELAATDPRAAAQRYAELRRKVALPPTLLSADQGGNVTSPAAPPPPRTLDAGSPLASTVDTSEQEYIASLEKRFNDGVELNQKAPNRFTMRQRADAIIAYAEAAYRKAMGSRSG